MSNTANRPVVDARGLWAGGAATALVAGLVALVGVLVCQGVFDVVMVRPPLIPIGDSFAVRYATTAAVLALLATALGHLLAVTTPRPQSSSPGSSGWRHSPASSCRSRWTGRWPVRWPLAASTWSSGWPCSACSCRSWRGPSTSPPLRRIDRL